MTWLAPVVLAGLVMLPRLASPQFGFLDDGLTLQIGREVVGRWSTTLHLNPETGRFVPAYWLVYSAIAGVTGARPLAFFLVNGAILAALLAILARLVRAGGGSPGQATVAVVLFALCGPTIESFYTLSKPEPLQLLWIGGALLATVTAMGAPSPRRAALIALAAGLSLLAYATKETSAVLVPISLGWLALEWASGDRGPARRFAATYAAVNVAAAAAFLALRVYYAPLGLAEGTYTRAYVLDARVVAPALFRIAAWLLRDFAFLLPLLAFTLVRSPAGRPRWGRPIRYAGVWMAGWLAVFLPWPATFEYYLLPFALGAATAAGLVVGDGWAARDRSHPAASRRLAWSALAASGLLWLGTVVNAVADARVQLTVDRANADLVDFLADLPEQSRIVLNTAMNEYHLELPRHLREIERRPDLVVEAPPRGPLDGRAADRFVVTPELANRPWPTVRLALDEPGVRRDHARLGRLLAGPSEPVYRSVRRARLVEVGLHRWLCRIAAPPLIDSAFCPGDGSVLDRRLFSYGWQVHRLPRSDGGSSRRDG
ncbi:MAG TPA: hypothetical protein VID28_02695 [Methylomirabilota bacterium]